MSFLVADIGERMIYDVKGLFVLTDGPQPVVCFEIGDPEPFDEEERKAAEEAEHEEES